MSGQIKFPSILWTESSPRLFKAGSHASGKNQITKSILSPKCKITALKSHVEPYANDERGWKAIIKGKIFLSESFPQRLWWCLFMPQAFTECVVYAMGRGKETITP